MLSCLFNIEIAEDWVEYEGMNVGSKEHSWHALASIFGTISYPISGLIRGNWIPCIQGHILFITIIASIDQLSVLACPVGPICQWLDNHLITVLEFHCGFNSKENVLCFPSSIKTDIPVLKDDHFSEDICHKLVKIDSQFIVVCIYNIELWLDVYLALTVWLESNLPIVNWIECAVGLFCFPSNSCKWSNTIKAPGKSWCWNETFKVSYLGRSNSFRPDSLKFLPCKRGFNKQQTYKQGYNKVNSLHLYSYSIIIWIFSISNF
jgi:hypothetical protein